MSHLPSEKLCLRWNDFESNIGAAFRDMRGDKDFFDVTIACDDEQIQAHKVILSACSPFFRNILRRNPHQHPLLYLKGVKYSDLQSVLNFMYNGEVNVAQEELNSFLAVAEDLRVKGLTQNQSESKTPSAPTIKTQYKAPERDTQPKRPRPIIASQITKPLPQTTNSTNLMQEEIQEVVPIKSEPKEAYQAINNTPTNTTSVQEQSLAPYQEEEVDQVYEDYNQYEEEQYMEADNSQHIESNDRNVLQKYLRRDVTDSGSVFVCTICGKTNSQKNNVLNHVEGVHFPNQFVYHCQYCEKTMKTKNALYKHISSVHNERNQII